MTKNTNTIFHDINDIKMRIADEEEMVNYLASRDEYEFCGRHLEEINRLKIELAEKILALDDETLSKLESCLLA